MKVNSCLRKNIFLFLSFLTVLTITLSKSYAQDGTNGAMLQPKFYIVGVEDISFPAFNGKWKDTVSVSAYGIRISKWLHEHSDYFNTQLSNPDASIIFSWKEFALLDEEGRAAFKKVATEFEPALRVQKNELIEKFQKENPVVKGQTGKNFYRDGVQVYFMNKKDVDYLIASLKK